MALLCILTVAAAPVFAQNSLLTGPPGSGAFGRSVTALSNGNFVVTDPSWDSGFTANVGAVRLYDGQSLALISTLRGSKAGDSVGQGGVYALSNGNFVVMSPFWKHSLPSSPLFGASGAGAVTWVNGTTGLQDTVSAANSLVGTSLFDNAGSGGVQELSSGNYLVISPLRRSVAEGNGAVTWGSGLFGISGSIGAANSLVGFAPFTLSAIPSPPVINIALLTNGHYVVSCSQILNGNGSELGSATWCDGRSGRTGIVSSAISLVGSKPGDRVGHVVPLTNGNYVVCSPYWDSGIPATR